MRLREAIPKLLLIGVSLLACERRKPGPPQTDSGEAIPATIPSEQKIPSRETRHVVRIVGDFTAEELDSIRDIVKREGGAQHVVSIVRRGRTVTATTCDNDEWPPCGHGCDYVLEKVDQKWTIVRRGWWES
jgi:hypothetical protein